MNRIIENLDISDVEKYDLKKSFKKAVLSEALKQTDLIKEEYEKYTENQLTEIKTDFEDTIDIYLDNVVEDFKNENKEKYSDKGVKQAKLNALLEGFDSLLITSGISLNEISSGVKDNDLNNEIEELREQNSELLKTGIIKELAEDMTDIQKNKFIKLASHIDFDQDYPNEFINKLEEIVETSKEIPKKNKIIQERKEVSRSWKSARHLY